MHKAEVLHDSVNAVPGPHDLAVPANRDDSVGNSHAVDTSVVWQIGNVVFVQSGQPSLSDRERAGVTWGHQAEVEDSVVFGIRSKVGIVVEIGCNASLESCLLHVIQ